MYMHCFTPCVILVHLTRFDIFTIVIIMIITSEIQSLLITLFYSTIVFHIQCFLYESQTQTSANAYPLSYIYIAY